ncbi:hypothetical protein EVAR_47678_1 [Eumeta japonica]|uniref:Uncharacterized protein n=1 Tax=Eumeta variegata TaxID=151549 RepID=A0A4C1Y1J3_EUMVA|nr:hypothetical protein EVAR_47678_1 [Eumeta japonica]
MSDWDRDIAFDNLSIHELRTLISVSKVSTYIGGRVEDVSAIKLPPPPLAPRPTSASAPPATELEQHSVSRDKY